MDEDNKTTTTNNPMGASALLASLSGIFSAIGGVWSSTNNIKLKKLELSELEKEAENAENAQNKALILKALEVKKEALASQEASEKTSANLRGVLIVSVTFLVGLVVYLRFKKKPNA